MSGPLLLILGLAAFTGAVLVAVLSLSGSAGAQVALARALAAVHRTGPVGTANPRDLPLRERLVKPFTSRLAGVGRALTPAGNVARLQRHLNYAGNPQAWPVERLIAVKGLTLVGGAVAGGAFGLLGSVGGGVVGAVLGTGAGLLVPDLMMYNVGLKRQQALRLSLPDVLDTLVICVEAGLAFDAAVAQVAHNGKGPMAREMVRLLHEMRIGKSRVEAMRAMSERTTVAELKTFVTAVVQAGELGVPIANILREHAREMRVRRRQRAEELAQKVPIKILFPVLFCIFPALFVVILGPGILQIVHAFGDR